MGGHDDVSAAVLAPEERRREMDGVERAEFGWKRLGGTSEHRRRYLDDFDALEEPVNGFPPSCQVLV